MWSTAVQRLIPQRWAMVGAAAWVAGCNPGADSLLVRLESPDPADRIRTILAVTAAPAGVDRQEAAAALVDRLDDEDEAVRFFAIAALDRLTGQRFGYRSWSPPGTRTSAVDRWRAYVSGARGQPGIGGAAD